MDTSKFAITKEGQVYYRQGCFWIRLGFIASILRDQTAIGQHLHSWWRKRLVSDEPTVNLVIEARLSNLPAVLVSETNFVPAWEPRPESLEVSLAA